MEMQTQQPAACNKLQWGWEVGLEGVKTLSSS
jgi:hypothetical protein